MNPDFYIGEYYMQGYLQCIDSGYQSIIRIMFPMQNMTKLFGYGNYAKKYVVILWRNLKIICH